MPKAGFTNQTVQLSATSGLSREELQAIRSQLFQWRGKHAEHGRAAFQGILGGSKGIILRDRKTGQVVGLASYSIERDAMAVLELASSGTKSGSGTRIMRQLARIASAAGLGVILDADREAVGFYKRIGMQRTPDGWYNWTAAQAAAFARGK